MMNLKLRVEAIPGADTDVLIHFFCALTAILAMGCSR